MFVDVGDLGVEAEKSACSDRHFECFEFGKLLGVVPVEPGAFLDLGRIQHAVLNDEDVDLGRIALLGPEIIDRSLDSGVGVAFQNLRDAPCLEEMPGCGREF